MPPVTTLTGALLDPVLHSNPAGPCLTFYDDATGERVELSAATLANWAAKTANLLRDDWGGGPGWRLAVLAPAHWQTAAVLLGAWWIGAEVVFGGPAEAAMCTVDRLAEADAAVADGNGSGEIAVLSLDAFGRSVPDLPIGVDDYASAVRVHGDQIVAEPSPGPALPGLSVEQVLADCRSRATAAGLTSADRVLSTMAWPGPAELIEGLLSVLSVGASLVQVAHLDPGALARRREMEKVTRVLPDADSGE